MSGQLSFLLAARHIVYAYMMPAKRRCDAAEVKNGEKKTNETKRNEKRRKPTRKTLLFVFWVVASASWAPPRVCFLSVSIKSKSQQNCFFVVFFHFYFIFHRFGVYSSLCVLDTHTYTNRTDRKCICCIGPSNINKQLYKFVSENRLRENDVLPDDEMYARSENWK